MFLTTGCGGSIGQALTLELIRCGYEVIGVDSSEYNLYDITTKINSKSFTPILGNVSNPSFLKWLFNKYKIVTIFHAAAAKHLPILEKCPIEGIINNTLATNYLLDISRSFGNTKYFTFISTDKASDPICFLGRTKRVSESLVKSYHTNDFQTRSVRFCNIMNSSGSVLPLFKKQSELGDDITVTDISMSRYFISIQRAVKFILDASLIDNSDGDVFILKEFEEHNIYEIAKIAQLYNYLFNGIKSTIKIQGNRGNEKIIESLKSVNEVEYSTNIDNIKRIKVEINKNLGPNLSRLISACNYYETDNALTILDNITRE